MFKGFRPVYKQAGRFRRRFFIQLFPLEKFHGLFLGVVAPVPYTNEEAVFFMGLFRLMDFFCTLIPRRDF
jgi:hypothetical protein